MPDWAVFFTKKTDYKERGDKATCIINVLFQRNAGAKVGI
jgi:hypothetical protein